MDRRSACGAQLSGVRKACLFCGRDRFIIGRCADEHAPSVVSMVMIQLSARANHRRRA